MRVTNQKRYLLLINIIFLPFVPVFLSGSLVSSRIFLVISPSDRYGHDMTFDIYNERIILYGGVIHVEGGINTHSTETWSFTSQTQSWERIPTLVNPGPIAHHAMAYDSIHHKIICFGGLSTTSEQLNTTWIFDCDTNEWTKVSPPYLLLLDLIPVYISILPVRVLSFLVVTGKFLIRMIFGSMMLIHPLGLSTTRLIRRLQVMDTVWFMIL